MAGIDSYPVRQRSHPIDRTPMRTITTGTWAMASNGSVS
jgi:hypothetical protein